MNNCNNCHRHQGKGKWGKQGKKMGVKWQLEFVYSNTCRGGEAGWKGQIEGVPVLFGLPEGLYLPHKP